MTREQIKKRIEDLEQVKNNALIRYGEAAGQIAVYREMLASMDTDAAGASVNGDAETAEAM